MSSELLPGVNNNYYNFNQFSDESRVRKSGRHRKTGHYNSKNTSKAHNEAIKYNQDGDSYAPSATRKSQKGMSRACKAILTTVLSIIFAVIIKQAMSSALTAPAATYETNGYSVGDLAEMEGVDKGAILRANNLKEDDDVPEKIVMPQQYTALDDAITMLKGKLENTNLNEEDKELLNQVYAQMLTKKEKQDETGNVSTDGKYVYISLNKNINAEDLKLIFGIADGATRKNNNVSPSYSSSEASGPDYGPSGYWDYDTYVFKKGETVKIPLADFNIEFQALLASI